MSSKLKSVSQNECIKKIEKKNPKLLEKKFPKIVTACSLRYCSITEGHTYLQNTTNPAVIPTLTY